MKRIKKLEDFPVYEDESIMLTAPIAYKSKVNGHKGMIVQTGYGKFMLISNDIYISKKPGRCLNRKDGVIYSSDNISELLNKEATIKLYLFPSIKSMFKWIVKS